MQLPNGLVAFALTILLTKSVNEILNSPKKIREFDELVREIGNDGHPFINAFQSFSACDTLLLNFLWYTL